MADRMELKDNFLDEKRTLINTKLALEEKLIGDLGKPSEGIIDDTQAQTLKSITDPIKRRDKLIDILKEGSVEQFIKFCKILKKSPQAYLVADLQQCFERDMQTDGGQPQAAPTQKGMDQSITINASQVTIGQLGHIGHQVTTNQQTKHNTGASWKTLFRGKNLQLIKEEGSQTIHWKQNSIFGFGGDRSQTYNVCNYQTIEDKVRVLVFIQKDYNIRQNLRVNSGLQYGMVEGILFFVLHDKEQRPYQKRFIPDLNANHLQQLGNLDLSWIMGNYLEDF